LDSTSHRRKALKADPAAQLALLGLQELDARADLLRHQRETLPELAEIAALTATRAELDGNRRDAQISVDDLTAEQAKVDADVEQVKTRRTRDQDRMAQGLISNPKDLERMQGELESLQRRITSLEDDELEVMARLEDAQKKLDALTQRVADADQRLAELGGARDTKTQELDHDLQAVAADRGPTVSGVPEDLLALYDRLRASKNGVAVGALRARECSGCRLALDPTELAAIRSAPDDLVLRHEECQRILIRTPESGL
jgi:predicted  nucleic acid-binding Zn-ribbon protein